MMQSNNSQRTPEQQSSPEGQALNIRLGMIPVSVSFTESSIHAELAAQQITIMQTQETVVRPVSPQATNSTVAHVLSQPTMEDQARTSIAEIHGVDNEYKAAA